MEKKDAPTACQKEPMVYNTPKHGFNIMRQFLVFFSMLALIGGISCTSKEEEQEPDYDHMVMADEEEEWTTGDRKSIAKDLPDPQELIILEVPETKE